MNILHSYTNGNTRVELYDDGTKIRHYEGKPLVVHPESLDVKITDYCDGKCSYCHEKSTVNGKHGDLAKLEEVLSVLPPGVEIAIGGGNPLEHPLLLGFLMKLKSRGLVANMTVNQKHVVSHQHALYNLVGSHLIHGIGISYQSQKDIEYTVPLMKDNNLVFHMIMGINTMQDVEDCYNFCRAHGKPCKILILGYKSYGFGLNHLLKNKQIEDNKYQWYIGIARFFKKNGMTISFDNLAIEQLKLKRYFTPAAWDQFYMGHDGVFTMYIDGVKQEFAKSSTSDNRLSFSETNLIDFFKSLPKE
jgi:hypothetical protein